MNAFYESRKYNSRISIIAFQSENLDFVAHWHEEIEMVYVCEGSLGVCIQNEYRVLNKGELAICGCGDIHYYSTVGDFPSITMLTIFKPEVLRSLNYWPDKLLPCSAFIGAELFSNNEQYKKVSLCIRTLLCTIIEEMELKQDLYPLSTSLELYNVFLTIFRNIPAYFNDCKNYINSKHDALGIKPMQKALRFLEDNYTLDITLDQIANEVNLSRFYFSRLFKLTTGMNFNSYLTRIRVDKAETAIISTGKTILEIAYEAGFNSIRTFNRAFKAIKGCTPQSLRG